MILSFGNIVQSRNVFVIQRILNILRLVFIRLLLGLLLSIKQGL